METFEDSAQCSSEPVLVQTSVKQEPVSDSETDLEQNINKSDQTIKPEFQDDQTIKAEPHDGSDGSDAAMYDSDCDQDLPVMFEAGDPEAAGRIVDCGLRGRLKGEEPSPDPNGN